MKPATGVLLLLALSVASLLAAPLLMPESYSWLTHTTSESAAQGVEGAWLARLGFLSFGLAVIWLSGLVRPDWSRSTAWMHLAFGVFMIATAAFSHKPWIDGVPFDPFEDTLHSFTATAMGFAFSFGALARFFQRDQRDLWGRLLDMAGVAAAVVIPLLMFSLPNVQGLAQRLMFLVAYVWYGREAWFAPDPGRKAGVE